MQTKSSGLTGFALVLVGVVALFGLAMASAPGAVVSAGAR